MYTLPLTEQQLQLVASLMDAGVKAGACPGLQGVKALAEIIAVMEAAEPVTSEMESE